MCRLSAITSGDYISPMENIYALETMKEGHDGSGLGLMLKDMGGPFADFKQYPTLSAICSHKGLQLLDDYMRAQGFVEKFSWEPPIKNVVGVARREHYLAKVYDYPALYKDRTQREKEDLLLQTRLALRIMGEPDGSLFVFSFYPDVLTLKEVGDPLQLSEFFGIEKSGIRSRIVLAQGRQNTNYAIYLYACHPFFIQGYATMTNGENTAFVPIREFLMGRGNAGYMGYNSDSEVFTHILHYTNRTLGYPLHYYKDIITPMKDAEIGQRSDAAALRLLKKSLRPLCIDGPNCVIGFTPDGSVFMVHDSKKLRPGAVGGKSGKYALMSEVCGVDSAIPDRDKSKDIFPMKYDMVVIAPGAREVKTWNQLHG
ncbi:MAG TPA: glutamate synthase [Nitrospirota bacterium]|nr:glutamate synthase [Nitrospirota bacterium]